ncbi:MAG: YbaN family protein [Paracoccaceae bacterium]
MLRAFWFVAGGVALVLGIVGVFLPLLPTTPFLLLAAFCFARSSPKVEMWLVEHPRLGPPIRDWRREGAIAPRAKALALGMIGATFALSLVIGVPTRVLLIQAVVLGCVVLFIATRPSPR